MLGISSSSRVNPSFSSIRDEQMALPTTHFQHYASVGVVPLFVLILSSGLKSVVFLSVDIYIYIFFYVCKHIFIYIYANNSIKHRFHFVTLPTFPWLQAIQYWECVHGTGSPGLVIKILLPISFMKWGEVKFRKEPTKLIWIERGTNQDSFFVNDEGMIDWLIQMCWCVERMLR